MRRHESCREDTLSIRSFGGTGGFVTGSWHRLDATDFHLGVDCGMAQGLEAELHEDLGGLKKGTHTNLRPIDEIMEDVRDIAITHTHIDHVGNLPIVFRKGYEPRVWATTVTAAFMKPMLLNSAEIQQSEGGEMLYEEKDAYKAIIAVGKGVKPFTEIVLQQGKRTKTIEFLYNGHVMGSASVLYRDHSNGDTVLFTGDIGKPTQSLCGGYEDFADSYPQIPIRTMLVESTSFDKVPVTFKEKQESFLTTINEILADGGNVLLPALSFHRLDELMEMLRFFQDNGLIPYDYEIIIDSPLGTELLGTFKELGPSHLSLRYGDDPKFYRTASESMNRFTLKKARFVGDHNASLATDEEFAYSGGRKKAIIIAGGGMGEHGRSVNYIRGKFGENPRNAIVFTCYQVAGTAGADLLNRKYVGNHKKVGARIIQIDGFTSHATGAEQFFGFWNRFNLEELGTVIIAHGKNRSRNAMAEEIKRRGFGARVILSEIDQKIAV